MDQKDLKYQVLLMHQHYQDTKTQNVVIQAVSIFSVKQIDGNLPQKSILIVNQGQQTPRKKHYKSLKEVDRNAITETSCSGHWWRHNGHRQQHQQSKLDYATLSKIRNECTTFFNCKQGLSLGGHILTYRLIFTVSSSYGDFIEEVCICISV